MILDDCYFQKVMDREAAGTPLQPSQLQQVKAAKANLSQVVGRLGKSTNCPSLSILLCETHPKVFKS